MVVKINKLFKAFIIVIFTSISFSHVAFANVSASLDKTTVAVGQSFTLNLHVDNFSDNPNFKPLEKNFKIYDTTTSSSISSINGKTSSNFIIHVTLVAKKIGNLEIPSITIGSEKTKPIKLKVVKRLTNYSSNQNTNIFAIGKLTSNKAYINSPIIYTMKVYISPHLSLTSASLKPFNVKGATMESTKDQKSYRTRLNGKIYNVVEINFIINPNKIGELIIPSITLQANIGQFFNVKTMYVSTEEKKIQILAIPQNISIKDWLPSSNLKISDKWSSNNLKQGELTTRTITIEAQDTVSSSIPKLNFKDGQGYNIYPEKPILKDKEVNGRTTAFITYKIGYIPTSTGKIIIPEKKINWYDIKNNKKKTTVIGEKIFTVAKGQELLENNKVSNSKEIDNNQIKTNKIANNYQQKTKIITKIIKDDFWRNIAILFIVLWIITLVILLVFIFKKNRTIENNDSKNNIKITNSKKYLLLIKKYCSNENKSLLSEAIIDWARIKYSQNIYSVLDVIDYNEDLKDVLKEFYNSIYSNEKFNNYLEIYNKIKITEKNIKTNIQLSKDFFGNLYD